MNKSFTALGIVALTGGAAGAGGIDRSGQNIGVLFEQGNYVELSFAGVNPDVGGVDRLGNAIDSVGIGYGQSSLSYKQDINDKLSFAVILDQPLGADISYPGNRATTLLGGTQAFADALALTGLLRYKFNDNISVHAGIRAQRSEANIVLSGLAYGPLNGYSVDLGTATDFGYVAGAAYERPEIALRVALTYFSPIEHTFDTVEGNLVGPAAALNGLTTQTDVETPQSVNLDVQTGIAKDTLVFGQIRWVDWSALRLSPRGFQALTNGASLIEVEDTFTYTLGVGRKFNETWSGSISVNYEKEIDPLASPLSPTTGRLGVVLAAIYTKDNLKITTGISYTSLGDTTPETGTPDVARADFTDNSALGVGVRVGFRF